MNGFFKLLQSYSSPNVFNPWTDTDEQFDIPGQGPAKRLERLKAHLACEPLVVLTGEAVGHLGARRSGIAFTSERLICEGAIPRVSTQGQRITSRRLPFSEPSATIIWGALHLHGLADRAILWNAFAWHPHDPGDGQTNRTPTAGELDAGKEVFRALLSHFHGVPVVAVGRTSEGLLSKLGIATDGSIRHPANGGASECRLGIADWAQRTDALSTSTDFSLTG